MISPTVGRVVHYHDKAISPEPLCALIAGVVDQKRVNLTVFDSQGNYAGGHPMIPLIQDGEEVPDGPHCSWMAFQKGQASKNDNLEPRLNAVEEALRSLFPQGQAAGKAMSGIKSVIDEIATDQYPDYREKKTAQPTTKTK